MDDRLAFPGGLGHSPTGPGFGFLDATRLYFARLVPADARDQEPSVELVILDQDEERIVSVARHQTAQRVGVSENLCI